MTKALDELQGLRPFCVLVAARQAQGFLMGSSVHGVRVLVIDGYPNDHPDGHIVAEVVRNLEDLKHDVEQLALAEERFAGTMTATEHAAYETDQPLVAPETIASAEAVQRAQALMFCYPSTLFGVPPRLKSWLERVMVLGVAFGFDEKQRIRPALTNVGRLGVVTTSPHSALATWRARDGGHRVIMRSLRLNCHPTCRRTFVRLPTGKAAGASTARIARSLRRW